MTADDIEFADSIRALVGWNQTLQDWKRFLSLEPEGCFVAERDGTPAGTATTCVYGSELAWIGMVLVHPNARRQGIGKALLTHCIDHLKQRGARCIKLDATPLGKAVYLPLGFEEEWTLTRWERAVSPKILDTILPLPPGEGRGEGSVRGEWLRSWNASDLDWGAPMDSKIFGTSRARLLDRIARDSARGFVVRDSSGHQNAGAYGFLRDGARAKYLGPIIASAPALAAEVIHSLLDGLNDHSVFWDIPDQNTAAITIARDLGFTPQRTLTRMFLGGNVPCGDVNQMFAIVAPEVG